jgi:hypothetical protein
MDMLVVILVIVAAAAVWYSPYGENKSVGHPTYYGFADSNSTQVMGISILCSIFSVKYTVSKLILQRSMPEFLIYKTRRGKLYHRIKQIRNAWSFVDLSFVFIPSFCWQFWNDMLQTPAPVATFDYPVVRLLSDREVAPSCPSPVSLSTGYWLLSVSAAFWFQAYDTFCIEIMWCLCSGDRVSVLRDKVHFSRCFFLHCVMYIVTINLRLNKAWCKTTQIRTNIMEPSPFRQSRSCLYFLALDGLLPRSQEPTIGHFSEPVEPKPHPNRFFYSFQHYLSIYN